MFRINFELVSNIFKIIINSKRNIHLTSPISIGITEILRAEPPKAKKRVDPALLKAKEDRKRRKIEKEIKKLEKFGRKLKPIEELRAEQTIIKEADIRKRQKNSHSNIELYDNQNLEIQWSKYKSIQFLDQAKQIQALIKSQEKALNKLKNDNLKLYEMAIEIDQTFCNFEHQGPSYTPAIKQYECPEGDYIDVTYLYDRK